MFRLAPAEEDTTLTILKTRRLALSDRELSAGAKVLFCWLLDLSLLKSMSAVMGAVIVSLTKLGEHLGTSRRSIFRWKTELISKKFLWVDKHYVPNFWAMNTYHITALNPPEQPRQLAPGDGVWGNGKRRGSAPLPSVDNSVTTPPQNADPQKAQENATLATAACQIGTSPLPNLATDSGQICPLTLAKSVHSPLPNLSTDSGQNCHLSRAKSGTRRKPKLAHLREPLARSREQSLRGGGDQPPQNSAVEGLGSKSQAWLKWQNRLGKLYPRELDRIRADLVKQLEAVKKSPKSVDLSASELKPKIQEWLEYAEKEIKRLDASQAPEDRQLAARKRLDVAEAWHDPKSFSRLALNSQAQAQVELLKRKIAAVDEHTQGPTE